MSKNMESSKKSIEGLKFDIYVNISKLEAAERASTCLWFKISENNINRNQAISQLSALNMIL